MPIGVPKVPYLLPGESTPQWIDIYNRLSRERVLFLTQEIEETIVNQLIGLLIYLSSTNEKSDIFIYINSPGGAAASGLALVDTISYVNTDVRTINVGTAYSIASFVIAGGRKGKRVALTHSRIVLYQHEGRNKGHATGIFTEADEVLRMRQSISRLYSEFTGQAWKRITIDIERGEFFSSRQAYKYGLIDVVRRNTQTLLS